jgi:predicted hydrocarbon binding protein
MVGLTRDALTALHAALFRETGGNAASYLQEAGYAGGGALHQSFTRWCADRGAAVPTDLATPVFQGRISEFFSELGWGPVTVGTLHDAVVSVDSPNWAESNPASGMQFPGCYLSAGMLADFFSRLADAQLVAMEVECRSMGHERCRFLLGSAETMQHVYDAMTQSVGYEDALASMP